MSKYLISSNSKKNDFNNFDNSVLFQPSTIVIFKIKLEGLDTVVMNFFNLTLFGKMKVP